MRANNLKAILKAATLIFTILPFVATAARGQQQVNLTAAPTSTTMPDGSTVPMWGYSCGTAVTGSTATCARSNPLGTGWSPVVITVPTGATGGLTINLTNSLSFSNGNSVPTSIMIVGQVGGGLGTNGTTCMGNHACRARRARPTILNSDVAHCEQRTDERAATARAACAILWHGSGCWSDQRH